MEVARMFRQMPSDILELPTSEYRRLQRYYFAVKDAESKAQEQSDEPGDIEL